MAGLCRRACQILSILGVFANLGKELSGAVGLGELPRLADALASVEGVAEFTLKFYRDGKGPGADQR